MTPDSRHHEELTSASTRARGCLGLPTHVPASAPTQIGAADALTLSSTPAPLVARDLTKTYGDRVVLDGVGLVAN